MALQENATYQLNGKDVVHINGRLYDPARLTQIVGQVKGLKPGQLTLSGQPVDLPSRTVDDDHVMTQQNVHGDIYA